MRRWTLKAGEPLSLTLAADARLGQMDYVDDQIWTLTLGSGEPPAIALQTTYGLRARSMRLLPRFTEGDWTVGDPAMFHRAPIVQAFAPNYVRLACSPFTDLDASIEYWVPESHAVAVRISLTNPSRKARRIRMEAAVLLTPTENGQRMAPAVMGGGSVLSGQTGGLAPVMFLTGGPEVGSGPYPALTHQVDLPPNGHCAFTFTLAALPQASDSFELARHIAARNWDAEVARIELLNAGHIDIHTGEPEWDAAFALAQKAAINLILNAPGNLAYPSFVVSRQPDQGYSPRGDGVDYNHLWNGQTPLEAYYLTSFILPHAPHLAQGLVYNFLSTAAENGFVDWKPGLGGQRSQIMATPILASLVERIYQAAGDRAFVEDVFPAIQRFFMAWFTPEHDRDGDGIPEWDHPSQTGLDDHPLFSPWHPWAQGARITTAESPDLCALLYRECQAILHLGARLGMTESTTALQALADNLKAAVEAAWEPVDACYHYWDRDTHYSTPRQKLGERTGPGELILAQGFDKPARVLARLKLSDESTRPVQGFIHGDIPSGEHRIERLMPEDFRWYLGLGRATSERVFSYLEKVELQGIGETDRVELFSVGYAPIDSTLLLPLWAGIPSQEHSKALVEQTITDPRRFWQPYGLRACASPPVSAEEVVVCNSVNILWNSLIGEGLIAYGYRDQAAGLVTRLMQAVVGALKRDGAFRRLYHAWTGQGMGERDALGGLAPLGLFLESIGVTVYSPRRVLISGYNPYPWPVTVKYRGLTVLRQRDKTIVIFPDGQTVNVDQPTPQMVSLE